jgi:hypothetical protein
MSLSGPTCWVQCGTSSHLVGSSDLAYKIQTVTELSTKKHDVSLGGDVTVELRRQTSSSTDMQQHFYLLCCTMFLLDSSIFLFLVYVPSYLYTQYFLSLYHFSLPFIFLPFLLNFFLYPYAFLFLVVSSLRILISLLSLFCTHLFLSWPFTLLALRG